MTSRINVLFAMMVAFLILAIVLANEVRKKDELIAKYQEYYTVSQELIAAQEKNNCLQDQIIKYYEYEQIPSELLCSLPLAVR